MRFLSLVVAISFIALTLFPVASNPWASGKMRPMLEEHGNEVKEAADMAR